MTAGARVTRLSTTPVKGLALHHPDAILLLRTGAAGDREFFVIDGRDRLVTVWKTGRLARFRATHDQRSHDEYPVTLLGEESVAELARQSGARSVDARRFRMLICFSGLSAHVEDGWQGQTIQIGEALVRVGGPVPRCAATTRDPDRGARDLPTLRMIKSYRGVQVNESGRGVNFGVYADVVAEGVVRVGDPLRVAEAGPAG